MKKVNHQELKQIKLMQSTFFNERNTKKELVEFILKSEFLSMGDYCEKFECEFARFHDQRHSVFYNSGSSANLALIQSLLNLGFIKPKDKVAFSGLTWATNVMPIFQLGLIPIPVDPQISTLNISSNELKKTIIKYPDIKMLFISNILGFCDDLDVIQQTCQESGIILIEDNCESLGSVYKSNLLGNFGLAATSSFYVGHHMSTIEGGMVHTNSEELFEMLTMVRAHGWNRNLNDQRKKSLREKHNVDMFYDRYTFYDLGYNLRPSEINGFIGLHQMQYIQEIINKREINFKLFHSLINNCQQIYKLEVDHMDLISNFAYPIIAKTKNNFQKLVELFNDFNIDIRPIVGGNMVKQPFFLKYFSEKFDLPNCDIIHNQGFYFPNHPELNPEEIDRILSIFKKLEL